MTDLNNRIADLLYKFLHNDINDMELDELSKWIDESPDHKRLFEQLRSKEALEKEIENFVETKSNAWERINKGIAEEKVVPIRRSAIWRRVAVASVILIVVSASVYFGFSYYNRPSDQAGQSTALPLLMSKVTAPSSNRAVVVLSDGRQVELGSIEKGTLATEDAVRVSKLEDGSIVYNAVGGVAGEVHYNTINNPKGSKPVSLVLADGSMVWLNTASSITYPTAFNGKERVVTMTGEAYFEIARNESLPFKVNAGKSEITVLGTHFNVNAYDDESVLSTTLLEGSVKVTHKMTDRSIVIKPGQQIGLHPSGGMNVIDNVDTDEVMAWRQGKFKFRSTDISVILRQAARWYDLQIVYEGAKPSDRFTGGIDKDVNLEKFLAILQISELHFRLEQDRKLVITTK